MFFIKIVSFFLMMFSANIGVYSQLDVILKRATTKPILHMEGSNRDPESNSPSSESQELLKLHERIQDELRKIGVGIDSGINKIFYPYPHSLNPSILDQIVNEQRQKLDGEALPSFGTTMDTDDSDDSDDNPIPDLRSLQDFFKLMDVSMLPFEPRTSFEKKVSPKEQGNEDMQPVGVFTIIKISDDTPLQGDMDTPGKDDVKVSLMEPELGPTFVQGLMNSVVGAMKDMVYLVSNTTIGLNAVGADNQNGSEPKVDIIIKDHGRNYDIPHNAYIERTEPNVVNITWRSELKDLNNSLCMNVSKDDDGVIVVNNIRLRMLNGQGIHEYNKEDPVHIGIDKENKTEINLAEGIGLEFPHLDSLDVVVIGKTGKMSSHWMAVYIALLGLIVAGLIMLLSYILHSRNKYHTRKDSMSKQPIA